MLDHITAYFSAGQANCAETWCQEKGATATLTDVGKKKNMRAAKIPKKDGRPPKIVNVQWPCINSYHLLQSIVDSNALSLLQSDTWGWKSFWSRCSTEDWTQSHPALELAEEDQQCVMWHVMETKDPSKGPKTSWSFPGVHWPLTGPQSGQNFRLQCFGCNPSSYHSNSVCLNFKKKHLFKGPSHGSNS